MAKSSASDVTKKANIDDEFTDQNLIDLTRCFEDPVYFIDNFMKVQHATKGSIPLKMWDYQYEMVKAFHENRYVVALTGRQLGKTTIAAAYLLWKAMFTPDTTILIAANTYNQALEIMDRIRYGYENLPNFIRAGQTEYNKGTIAFDNGSKIISRATSPNAGRGLSVSVLYLDEFAFVAPNIGRDFWTAMLPVLSTGGSCIITSTPKSDEDQFAEIYKNALNNTDEYGNPLPGKVGKNGFFPITFKWDVHPDRDEAWETEYRSKLGDAKFRQEMCCEFVTDDETLINGVKLSMLKGIDPDFYTQTVRWYKEPEANKTYCVALDPSLGTGGDYAAIQVFELPEMIQVAEWQNNNTVAMGQVRILMRILMYIEQTMMESGKQAGEPDIFWTVENNTIGEAVLQIIEDTGEERFPGIFVTEKRRKGQGKRVRKGMNTDNKKKLSGCVRLKSLIETDRMVINSNQLIKELKFFVASGASFKAKSGEHDDLVMATCLVVRMLDVVLNWSNAIGDLKEHISDDQLFDDADGEDMDAGMPVVI
jgi:hypothetical protein